MISYPIYFLDMTCPHCASNTRFLDRNGNLSKTIIYPVEYIVCTNCKRRFFIEWINKGDKMVPVTCAKSSIDEFEKEISEVSIKNRRKL